MTKTVYKNIPIAPGVTNLCIFTLIETLNTQHTVFNI